jgi:hypothetical protein
MQCRDVRGLADAYLDEELLVETNHALLTHIDQCSACRAELDARRALRAQLKTAFDTDQRLTPTTEFMTALRQGLRPPRVRPHAHARPRRVPWWMGAAALLIIVAGFAVQWAREWRRPTVGTADMPSAVVDLAPSAAGDHRDCALRHRLAEPPMDLEQAASYDAAFRGLDEAVKVPASSLPSPLEPVTAHACVWQGRRFGHVVLSYRSTVVSLLVTDRGSTAAAVSTNTAPAECPTIEGFTIACFAAPRHAVFVVSDLASSETLKLATAIAPEIRAHLARTAAAIRVWLQWLA